MTMCLNARWSEEHDIFIIWFINYKCDSHVFSYIPFWMARQNIIKDIRTKLFSHLQNFKLQFFDKTPIGRIVTRNVSDIETIADIFGQGIAAIIGDILQLFGIVVLMFYINWKLTSLSLATLPFLFLTTYIFKEKVKLSFNNVRNAVANLNSYVQEHIIGMNIVQIFGNEEKEYKRFKDINETHLKANLKAVLYYSIYFPVMELFTSIGLGLLIWYGSNQLFQRYPWYFSRIYNVLAVIFRPIRSIADRFNTLQMVLLAQKEFLIYLIEMRKLIQMKN